MGRPYSMDLRERAVELESRSRRAAAVRFGVAASTLITWVAQFRAIGDLHPGQMGGHKPSWLVERCRGAGFTLRGLVSERAERGLVVDDRSVWDFVHAETLSYKKDAGRQRAGPSRRRPTPRAMAEISAKIELSRLVFIEETGTKTNMAPLRGWAPKGARRPGKAPFGHWNTMTLLAALRWDRGAAPWLLNQPSNGERFQTDVEKGLAPTLSPGDIAIMDNLGSKAKAVRAAIRGLEPSSSFSRNIPRT